MSASDERPDAPVDDDAVDVQALLDEMRSNVEHEEPAGLHLSLEEVEALLVYIESLE